VIEVFSLGRFQVLRDGQPLPACTSAKALAIFRYLLTRRGRAATGEELMELLWPDSAPRDAAHSLHVAVSTLRRYLDPAASGLLLYVDAHYLLNPRATVGDDCERFRALSAEGDRARRLGDLPAARQAYEDAVACYCGDYYVSSQDLAWNIAERERLLARYLTVLDHLGAVCLAEGQYEPALDCYQQLLQRDAYREDAHVQVMRCYAHLGRRSEALRQYTRCATLLASELGVEPLPETRAVYEQVRSGQVPA
jgi:DNA-binding SARP family transcriptional activator